MLKVKDLLVFCPKFYVLFTHLLVKFFSRLANLVEEGLIFRAEFFLLAKNHLNLSDILFPLCTHLLDLVAHEFHFFTHALQQRVFQADGLLKGQNPLLLVLALFDRAINLITGVITFLKSDVTLLAHQCAFLLYSQDSHTVIILYISCLLFEVHFLDAQLLY